MGSAPLPTDARLLCHYMAYHVPAVGLVLAMPWPGRVLVGCLGPVIVVIAAAVITRESGLGSFAFMASLFALFVVPIVLYQNRHAWVLSRGFIKEGSRFFRKPSFLSEALAVRSVMLERAIWPHGQGSTDEVLVVTDQGRRLRIVGVYNWAGGESRLGSGGMGSLARSGPEVPTAAAPLEPLGDANLRWAISAGVHEVVDIVVRELGVPLEYACIYARRAPDDVD